MTIDGNTTNHIHDLTSAFLDKPSVVTIGVFDGVHIGHQHLIRQLVAEAKAAGKLAVVLTFFPHPDVVLRGPKGRYYLTTPQQRAEALLALGVDYVITHPFNEQTRQIRAASFIDLLIKHLRLSVLWVGRDFALGYKREGTVAYLTDQARQKGFVLHELDLVHTDDNGTPISSTQIRRLLEQGDAARVRDMLGRGYVLSGEVVPGQKRGRTIGFPTANLAIWEEQVIPANGVYAGWAVLGQERFMAVTNVGVRPTFDGQSITIEAHILDFDRDIYGQTLAVTFETRLRGEKKFAGIQELVEQITNDVETGRRYLTQSTPMP